MVSAAFRICRGGVEERKEYLGHLVEILVAEAAEEESAGLRFGKLCDCGTERPGAGWIVRYVE